MEGNIAPRLKRKKVSVPVCPGFSQDRVTFCSSQEGVGPGQEVILYHLTVIAPAQGRKAL